MLLITDAHCLQKYLSSHMQCLRVGRKEECLDEIF